MAKDERNIYTIQDDSSMGEVKIADEVVAIIAALAATEVEGMDHLNGSHKRLNHPVRSAKHPVCLLHQHWAQTLSPCQHTVAHGIHDHFLIPLHPGQICF